jgi:tartrate dehydrogenase/decarboxylase/D-malate dehydrogenase
MTDKGGLRIAVIQGDGIGQEVVPAALRVLEKAQEVFDFKLHLTHFDWGSDYFRRNGSMIPDDGLETLATYDAILLGAVGEPGIPDTVTLWGLLIPIRRKFEQYVNLRPVKRLPGIQGPLSSTKEIDFVIVRENNEGEYSEVGGRMYRGFPQEQAIQESIFTRIGIERVTRFAGDLAMTRRKFITSATKSNGIVHTMPFWDEVFSETMSEYGGLTKESILIDALAAKMVLQPESFDVIVASNLFGDILSDLGSALTGSIGVAPSANLNPERRWPSLFEPVHGSAPDIAGKGVANPIGQIWSAAMMLEHLGFVSEGEAIVRAFESVLASGRATADLGGSETTNGFTEAVIEALGEDIQ